MYFVLHTHQASTVQHASTTHRAQISKTKVPGAKKRCVGTRHRHGHESHCVLNRARQLTSRPRDPYFSGKFRRSCARQYADAPAKPELRRSTGHPRCQLHLRPKRPAKTALSASTMRALGQILVLPALRERWLISQTHKQGLRSAGWRDGIYAYLPSRSR